MTRPLDRPTHCWWTFFDFFMKLMTTAGTNVMFARRRPDLSDLQHSSLSGGVRLCAESFWLGRNTNFDAIWVIAWFRMNTLSFSCILVAACSAAKAWPLLCGINEAIAAVKNLAKSSSLTILPTASLELKNWRFACPESCQSRHCVLHAVRRF